jgi:hypothetical protein
VSKDEEVDTSRAQRQKNRNQSAPLLWLHIGGSHRRRPAATARRRTHLFELLASLGGHLRNVDHGQRRGNGTTGGALALGLGVDHGLRLELPVGGALELGACKWGVNGKGEEWRCGNQEDQSMQAARKLPLLLAVCTK